LDSGTSPRSGLTPRALIVGLLLSAVAVFVVAWAELVVAQIPIAIMQFAPAAVGLLLLLVVLNMLVRLGSSRLALRPAEIVAIYAMVLVASLATSRGILEKWIPTLVCYNYYATPANDWARLLFPKTPQWAVPFSVNGPANQTVTRSFYEGLSPGQHLPWGAWATPLAAWGVAILLVLLTVACMASLLRRQWVDNEKLSFPLTVLPLELAKEHGGLTSIFRQPLLWIGLAIPTIIYTLNGLHANYPGFPLIQLRFPLDEGIKAMGRPWSDMGGVQIFMSMGALGFSYFLPAQLSLTMWSFFMFARLQNVAFSAVGIPPEGMPMYPTTLWNGYQVAGAFVVVVGYMLKSAWPYLRKTVQGVMKGVETGERELLPARLALLGLIVGPVGLVIFFVKLGMSPGIALLQAVVYLFITLPVMARSVNEAGLLETETSFRPVDLVAMFTPLQTMTPKTMTALSLTDAVFMRDQRGNLLSAFLDSLKLADAVRLDRRALLWALSAGLAVALILGGALHLMIPYRMGAVQLYPYVYQATPQWTAGAYAQAMQATPHYDGRLPIFFASGAAITLLMTFLRTRYLWWPLGPLGMALSGTYGLFVFWFPLMLAWMIKSLINRYGGMRGFMALRPFFLGLILGEFAQAVIWAALAGFFRLQAPFFPFG
jgi:hypothetical protein